MPEVLHRRLRPGCRVTEQLVERGVSVQPHSPFIRWLVLGASVPQFPSAAWGKLSSVLVGCSFIVGLMTLIQFATSWHTFLPAHLCSPPSP